MKFPSMPSVSPLRLSVHSVVPENPDTRIPLYDIHPKFFHTQIIGTPQQRIPLLWETRHVSAQRLPEGIVVDSRYWGDVLVFKQDGGR